MRDPPLKQLNPSQFLKRLLKESQQPVALVLHQSADPDAIGSAVALAALLTSHGHKEPLLYAESLNRSAKNIADAFHISLAPSADLAKHSTIILIDLNNKEQLGNLADHFPKNDVVVFCIDHHIPHSDLPQLTDYLLYDEKVRATAEIILQLWLVSKKPISSKVATLLACGIVYDSRHFHIAINSTFDHFMTLLKQGADYARVLNLLSTPLDKSERIARLKAARRTVVYDEFGLLIAATVIGSYEASAARALIGLGADIAIACARKKDEVRISARSISDVVQNWGLDLAKHVMEPLGELIGGAGGGHPSAAGANGPASSDHALGLALELLRKELKARHDTSNAVKK